ncbi:aldehyde dehydrogenase family protein [Rhodococcus wratislaviensis]|uniref:aldehyde dehydrogenase family protein n=1 Tax=Rhodococcus wratislaviensis TaxID=44752 RepID=UPI00365AD24E
MTVARLFTGETRMLIDGKLVDSPSGKTFDNINPATEEVLGSVANADESDMARAIASARRAFDETDWSTNHMFRRVCLEQLHRAIVSEQEQLREELIAEVGSPRALTYANQLDRPLDEFRSWPAFIDEFEWERVLPEESGSSKTERRVVKEARGVIGAIVPWNVPFGITLGKVAHALAAGNTIVVKPAPDTPWNATRLGRLVSEHTDIPPGVLNVVTTSDNAVAEQLLVSPMVDMISFTGSTATGKRVMELGAMTMKRVFLELGGKSAMIILDDADFASAVPTGAVICTNAGQGCVLPSRMLLPRSRYDEGVELITEAMKAVRCGDPNDIQVMAGPLINARQRERVLSYIDKGRKEGAKLVVGGGVPDNLERGYFVEPTLFVDVENSMTIAREEIFGPVLSVIPFEDDADAIRIANDSRYGLGGFIQSTNQARAAAVARRIRTGVVSINNASFGGFDAPFGGYKMSGVGRQNGIEGFNEHLETKTIATILN